MKVLIIEEQKGKTSPLTSFLSKNGIVCGFLYGKTNLSTVDHYDLLIIDVCTQDNDGIDVCKQLRSQNNGGCGPILMLSVWGDPEHMIKGLDAGADDYLVKPYHPDELMARMKALTRFKRIGQVDPIKVAGEIQLDTYRRTVTRGGKRIDLTGREFALLDLLISHKNRVLPRSYISEAIWGITFDRKTNLVDVYIKYLRQKIDVNFGVPHIRTVIGRGYVFNEG
jgi:DNA-binding response OmpR family regulator